MTVGELKTRINELAHTGTLKSQSVEFVCDNQKYFLVAPEKDTLFFKLKLSRHNYFPLPWSNFLETLGTGNDGAAVELYNVDKSSGPHQVTKLYVSDSALEISI
jgi:hypothetical protein